MSKQTKNQQTNKVRPDPTPFAIFPTGPAITAKLAAYEQQTGLDPALIIRCLILGSDVKLVRVCARQIGLVVMEEEQLSIVNSELSIVNEEQVAA